MDAHGLAQSNGVKKWVTSFVSIGQTSTLCVGHFHWLHVAGIFSLSSWPVWDVGHSIAQHFGATLLELKLLTVCEQELHAAGVYLQTAVSCTVWRWVGLVGFLCKQTHDPVILEGLSTLQGSRPYCIAATSNSYCGRPAALLYYKVFICKSPH